MKAVARDFVALGGLPFFVLVLVRVWILDLPEYFMSFVIAGAFVLVCWRFFRIDLYSALSFVVLIFTAIHYGEVAYWVVGGLVWVGVVVSSWYLSKDWKKVLAGVVVGFLGIWFSMKLFDLMRF